MRRERPHPGAQLSFTDVDGHRFQCFITDQPDDDLGALEARHRAHAIVEDRVRDLKSTGLSNLPFSAFEPNQAWLEAALCALDLTVWTQLLLFDGEHEAGVLAYLWERSRKLSAHTMAQSELRRSRCRALARYGAGGDAQLRGQHQVIGLSPVSAARSVVSG